MGDAGSLARSPRSTRRWIRTSNQELGGEFPYVYLDGIVLRRSSGGEVQNVSVLVAIGLGSDGFQRIVGVWRLRKARRRTRPGGYRS